MSITILLQCKKLKAFKKIYFKQVNVHLYVCIIYFLWSLLIVWLSTSHFFPAHFTGAPPLPVVLLKCKQISTELINYTRKKTVHKAFNIEIYYSCDEFHVNVPNVLSQIICKEAKCLSVFSTKSSKQQQLIQLIM